MKPQNNSNILHQPFNNYYYYDGLILPLYPVLCCFKRDFYSVSSGSRDISVLLSLFQFLFIYFFFYLFIFSFRSLLLFSFSFSSSFVSFFIIIIFLIVLDQIILIKKIMQILHLSE